MAPFPMHEEPCATNPVKGVGPALQGTADESLASAAFVCSLLLATAMATIFFLYAVQTRSWWSTAAGVVSEPLESARETGRALIPVGGSGKRLCTLLYLPLLAKA